MSAFVCLSVPVPAHYLFPISFSLSLSFSLPASPSLCPLSVAQKLVKTGDSSWSLAELVHVVVLLAHFHALASFVLGSGVNPERDAVVPDGLTHASVNSECVCDLDSDSSLEEAPFIAAAGYEVRAHPGSQPCCAGQSG